MAVTKFKITSFTDLQVWQEAQKLAAMVYKLTSKFPNTEVYGLTSQMRRAAVSISSNIAEGFHRFSLREKVQFYSIAIESTAELHSQILFSETIQYTNRPQTDAILEQVTITQKLTNGLIRSTKGRRTI